MHSVFLGSVSFCFTFTIIIVTIAPFSTVGEHQIAQTDLQRLSSSWMFINTVGKAIGRCPLFSNDIIVFQVV